MMSVMVFLFYHVIKGMLNFVNFINLVAHKNENYRAKLYTTPEHLSPLKIKDIMASLYYILILYTIIIYS